MIWTHLKRGLIIRSLCTVGLLILSFAASPSRLYSGQGQAFYEFGYGDLTARSMYGSLSYYFTVPRGQVPQEGSQIELVYSHSPLLEPERSTMTVIVNRQSLTSVFLTHENREHAHLIIPLPVQGFVGKGFFIEIQFSLRLTKDECEETQNPALWATVHRDSVLKLLTKPSGKGPGLEDLSVLYSPSTTRQIAPGIILPPNPQPEELEAAGLVAFQLGRWAAAVGQDPKIELFRTLPPDRPAIIVTSGFGLAPLIEPNLQSNGTTWMPVYWNGQNFMTTGGIVPNNHGILALVSSGQGEQTSPEVSLFVTGATPGAVLDAADALVRPERRRLLAGNYAILTRTPVARPPVAAPWQEETASFAQFGIERRQFTGPGEHVLELMFERPSHWNLRDGSALELAIETSPGLRTDSSWIAVTVNNYDVGTRRLQPGDRAQGRYRFELPPDLLNTDLKGQPIRRLALQVRLYLDIPQIGCTQTTPSSAWASVLPTSAWLLPHDNFEGYDLGRFPASLLDANSVTPLSLILPENPNIDELAAGLQVMAALGRWTMEEVTMFPRLKTAEQLSNEERQKNHLILLGSPARNSASEIAVRLAQALSKPDVPAVYRLTSGERKAYLYLLPSPWARDRKILLLWADEAGSLNLAAAALAQNNLVEQLQGRMVAVVDNLPPQTLVAAEPTPALPPALAPRIETPLVQRLPTWQVVGAILLGAFLVLTVIVVSSYWRRQARPTS